MEDLETVLFSAGEAETRIELARTDSGRVIDAKFLPMLVHETMSIEGSKLRRDRRRLSDPPRSNAPHENHRD
jgi:hypothetical protein